MTTDEKDERRQPLWFLLLLALATAGGAVAYVPFLTVLLPVRVSTMQGSEDVAALSLATFLGAITASVANILFGWLSDRVGGRRSWILAGLLSSCLLLVAVGSADTVVELILILMAWQVGLNMMLAPLAAWAGDCVPDSQKGLLGGLFAIAPALGALSGILVTFPGLAGADERLMLVAGLVIAMVCPALAAGGGKEMPHLMRDLTLEEMDKRRSLQSDRAAKRMWFARLLVQISEAALFAFLLFWLRSLAPGFTDNLAATLFGFAVCVAVPIALFLGRWSDRSERPMLPLSALAGISAVCLLLMASANTLQLAIIAYVLFAIFSMAFLSLHSAQTLRVLPRPSTRGRDLGVFNLTNTVPSIIIPGLAISLIPRFGFSALFVILAMFAVSASLLIASISRRI